MCFFTSARSEYGLIKWLMKDIDASDMFKLQLIVTGAHLLADQGHTIDTIIQDGFKIDATIDVRLDTCSPQQIAASIGRMAEQIAPVLNRLEPDYIVVLGDRYELLPICSTAYIMRIPIIHISGGDITEGAIDNGIRNAVTMLADYHFPGTYDSASNVIRMRNSSDNVWAVGEPGLDSFYREALLNRKNIAGLIGLDLDTKWALMTYHPETTQSLEYNLAAVRNCCRALAKLNGFQTVITYANADFGGVQINDLIRSYASSYPDKIITIPSLGNHRYLSLMKCVEFVIGNSSSGIIEAPMLKKHVINIGARQRGRHLCSNITQCNTDMPSIETAIDHVLSTDVDVSDIDYWGKGCTSETILSILKKKLENNQYYEQDYKQ